MNLLKRLLSKVPQTTIVNCERSEYLTRWYLFRTKPFAIFLHLFHRSDEDRALHDHPWTFVSIILWRGYYEHTAKGRKRYWPGMILYRPAEWTHRVELVDQKPALTLMLRFKGRREWGYHLTTGWQSHHEWWNRNCE